MPFFRTTTLALAVLTCLVSASGCGVPRRMSNSADSGIVGDDAFDPGNDAYVDPSNDAAVDPGNDTGVDPLNAPPTCTSGRTWRLGNFRSQLMNPGLACINCHSAMRGPAFTAAGTVYPTGHEPDLCNGATGTITVDIHDATGSTVTVTPNSAGNFFYQGGLSFPITATVNYMGRSRSMLVPVPSGDCNSCHTQNGLNGAPGRITLP